MTKQERSNSNLLETCRNLGIPDGRVDYRKYTDFNPTPEEALSVMSELDDALDHEVIMIGGQTVHPKLLGLRQMRKPSNDVDCVTTAEGVKKIHENFKGLSNFFLSEDHGDLFLEYQGFPIGFVTDNIHDWEIDQNFRQSALTLPVDRGSQITVASPEYTIMLKIRRADSKGKLFGKDRIDISSLLLAPKYRSDLRDVNMDEVASLTYDHVTCDYARVKRWIDELGMVYKNLNKDEMKIFGDISYQFMEKVHKRYKQPQPTTP